MASTQSDTPSAPKPTAGVRPWTRGLGLLSGLIAFGTAGFMDGVITLLRSRGGQLGFVSSVSILLLCGAIVVTLGLFLGLFEELVFESARRVPWLAAFGRWILAGPRSWFATNVVGAQATVHLALGSLLLLGLAFPPSYFAITQLQDRILTAVVVMFSIGGATLSAGMALLLLAGPTRRLATVLGRWASPGSVGLFGLGLAALVAFGFARRFWTILRNLDWSFALLGSALLLGNLLGLLVLGRLLQARGALSKRSVAITAGLALAAFVSAASMFGRNQVAAVAIFERSVLTQYLARGLQGSVDLDRDGFGALFGGGDCNDWNAKINPSARDVPGNGIDENCSGRDARALVEEPGGQMVALPARWAGQKPSFLLLSVDALRPDHLGMYGYRRKTSPNLDLLAREAAVFDNAYCAAPRSLRSFGSLWSGRYPSLTDWNGDNQFPGIAPKTETLAEKLHEAGWLTGGFINSAYFNHVGGFFQGFDVVRQGTGWLDPSEPARDWLLEFLRARDSDPQPFFAWIHFLETHDPYRDRTAPVDFGHADIDTYDENIAHVDQLLKPIIERARELARTRPLWIVLMADHGEAFGEHGVYHHSFDLHEEALRVPILIWGPGVAPGHRKPLVNLLDLHPTLLNLSGRTEAPAVSGRSLVGLLAAPEASTPTPAGWRDHIYAEVMPDGLYPFEQKTLIAPPFKIIHDIRRNTWQLFDIAQDPGERRNLLGISPELVSNYKERLLNWVESASSSSNSSEQIIERGRLPAEPRMQFPVHVRFGDIVELLGFDVENPRVPIRQELHLTFYYKVLRRTRVPCNVSVYFEPLDGQRMWPLFSAKHYPLESRYPTTLWNAGEILRDEVSLRVDDEMAPGRLQMVFAVEIAETMERIAPEHGGRPDKVVRLGEVVIVPPSP